MSVESLAAPVAASVENENLATVPVRVRRAATVEHLIYGVLLVAALGLRLFALGSTLYTPLEATTSWPAWLDAMALQVVNAPQPASALLHSLQTALFWLFDGGGSDATGNLLGRLPVALASASIVLLPWFWRDVLGRWSALALAFLLTFDPWLLVLGRTADGALLSTALALATVTALHVALHKEETVRAGSLAAALGSIALGLLVASGVQAWPWLLVVAGFLALHDGGAVRALLTPRNLILAVAALILGATTLLAQPDSLRVVSASLGAWLRRFGGGDYTLTWAGVRLLVDTPLVLAAGILGVIQAWRRPTRAVRLRLWLTLWLALGVVLVIAPGRTPFDLPLLGVALAIFAAILIGAIVEAVVANYRHDEWQDALLLGMVLVGIAVGVLFWGTASIWSAQPDTLDLVVTLGLVLLFILLVVVFAVLVSARQSAIVMLLVVGAVLLAFAITSAVRLVAPAQPGQPNGLFAVTVYPDLRHLPEDVRTLSDRRKGDNRELPVLVINDATRTPDPLLGWTLRSMRNLRFIDSWQTVATYADQTPPLVITPGNDVAVSQWNQYYLGSPYRTTVRWLPDALPGFFDRPEGSDFWSQSARPWLRWLLLREATPGVPEQVNLWATAQ